MRGIDLGVKFMEVPNAATEQRDEQRPCLKVFVSEPMNWQMKGEIAEAVVDTIRVKHKKQFYSEDHEAWLDFIPAIGRKDSIAELLSDRSEEGIIQQSEEARNPV